MNKEKFSLIRVCMTLACGLIVLCSCTDFSIENQFAVIAHRGYWDAASGADNSIEALQDASRSGANGIELDVCITHDDSLLIIHGPKHGGLTIADSDFHTLRKTRLPNGEVVPTLREYLDATSELDRKPILLIEPKDERAIAPLIEALNKRPLPNHTVIISFDWKAAKLIHSMSPTQEVWYIGNNRTPAEVAQAGFSGMSYEIDTLLKHPQWVDEAKRLGLTTGTWVVKYESELIWCATHAIDYVTTDEPIMAIQFLNNYK